MKNLSRFASPLMTVLLLSSPAYAAGSSSHDIQALKDQIAKLSQKVEQLESAKPAEPAKVDESALKGSFPGSFKVPGTDTSVKIGGYVKLDVIEDMGTGYGSNSAKFYAIPLSTSAQGQQNNQTTFGVQQSRFNIETRTPSSLGEIKTLIEADFDGSAASSGNTNGYGLRLRHAYGSVGPVLAGQTWSNFQDTNSMPETLESTGVAGLIFVRQPQVRYTHPVGPVTLSASAEAPVGNQSSVTQAAVTYTNGDAKSAHGVIPDLVARADYKYADNGYVSFRLLANQLNVDRSSGTNNYTAVKYGYGVALSGKQGVLGKDSVLYSFTTGNGTGRYLNDIGAAGNYYNVANNTLKTQSYYAGTLGYQHIWTDKLRSNIFAGGVRKLNDTDYSGSTANRYVASGHLNLIWQPAPSYKVGLEYMHGYRKIESGLEGNLNRLEGSFIYNF